MKKSRESNNILDECLERLLVKGESIEQCLTDYPERAAELEPLLQTALAVREASAIQPRPEFRARARYQFNSALQVIESRRSRPIWRRLPQWATIVSIVLVVLLAGSGTVAAASNSMPDSPLYPVKLVTEQAQLILTPSDIDKARLCTQLADRRVTEIIYMAEEDNPEGVELATQRLSVCLTRVADLVFTEETADSRDLVPAPKALPPSEGAEYGENGGQIKDDKRTKLRTAAQHYATSNPARLQAALQTAPQSVKLTLLQAIAVSEAGYKNILEALD